MDSSQKVDKLVQAIDSLDKSSPPEQIEALREYFSEDCVCYMASMREYDAPSIGRDAVVEAIKGGLKQCHTHQRDMLHRSTTSDGKTVFCETKASLHVLGELLDPLYETWVVTFDDQGLIKDLKKYSCRSHLVEIIQDKTGMGPYAAVPETRGQPLANVSCCR